MESPRKFNDCYFYYYSTCTKGDNCVFRHEPSALGCETMCTAWQQGKCLDKHCKLRHMELRKNRKQIPCYWENQPGGCRKKHCPFMHKNPDARTDGIAPSQPAPPQTAVSVNNVEPVAVEPQPMATGVAPSVPATGGGVPVPLLWQQQRPVVLDSAILGVLPASGELLGARRVVPHAHPHAHAHAHAHAHPEYSVGTVSAVGAVPVDPLVVNFEEESDNESVSSSTPTKPLADDATNSKSQELLLLEKIQAEAAAFYSYDSLAPVEAAKERKLIRTTLSTKYDRLSLDEITGRKQSAVEKRSSLDFKVLSLEEIKARKKNTEPILRSTPIALNLNRKRKLSTQETITTTGDKILKVVSSNSIVYKKLDHNDPAPAATAKVEQRRQGNGNDGRKRTLSEQTQDIYNLEDELDDDCYEFKRIKIDEQTLKPKLIRNTNPVNRSNSEISESEVVDCSNKMDDSDSEVQVVNVSENETDVNDVSDSEVIVIDSIRTKEIVDIVDLSDDQDDGDDEVSVVDNDLDIYKNVPDVVASCHKNTSNMDGV